MRNQWLYADVETTGVTQGSGVVEVAWILVDDYLVVHDKGHSIIDPEMPIPPESSAVHGLTSRDVVGAPTLDEYFSIVLGGIFSACDVIFCAYNSPFDYRFLHQYLPDWTPQMDLLRLARRIYPTAPNHKLSTMVYFLDLNVDKGRFHSADGDVSVLLDMTKRMSDDTGRSLYELFELANAPVEHLTMPFGKHLGLPLKDVPPHYVKWFMTKAENPDPDLVRAFKKLGY